MSKFVQTGCALMLATVGLAGQATASEVHLTNRPTLTRVVGRLHHKLSVCGLAMFKARHGRLMVHVRFPDGANPKLTQGQTLVFDAHNPLTVISLSKAHDDRFTYVEAVAQSRGNPFPLVSR